MSAVRPTIQHLDPGFVATCNGCGESHPTTRHAIATDWLRDHTCDPVARRRHALREHQARTAVAR